MFDWFKAVRIYVAPNDERGRWKTLQSSWLAMAEDAELAFEDDADDVWPLVRRDFRSRGVVVTLGAENFVEAEDRVPVEGLVCDVKPAPVRIRNSRSNASSPERRRRGARAPRR